MDLNDEQRAAICAEGSVVVTAGAGSGKTTVLANRVLFLLLRKRVALKNILVLTFTKKASSEMHERIHTQLLRCMDDQCFLGETLNLEDMVFLKEQLKTFEHAHISTIDSFFFTIAQEGAAHFGILGEITITENMSTHARNFIQRYFMQHRENPALEELIALHGLSRLCEIYMPLLLKTSVLHSAEEAGLKGARVLEVLSQRMVHSQEIMLTYVAQMREALETAGIQQGATSLSNSVQSFMQDLNTVETLTKGKKKDELKPEELVAVPLSLRGVTATKFIKEASMGGRLKDLLSRFKEAREYLCAIHATLSHSEWIMRNYREATALLHAWNEYKKMAMLFSYSDISHIAQKTMQSVHVTQRYIQSFMHIIVDEAQDNSKEQNNVLTLLKEIHGTTHAPHFFFVGDPKQSIYEFRGADVRSFVALTESQSMHKQELRHNYRSSPELIAFFNEIFASLFASTLDEYDQGQRIPYMPQLCAVAETKTQNREAEKSVNMLTIQMDEQSSHMNTQEKTAAEAFSIAKTVQEILKSGEYKAEDIAVLARTKTIFSQLQKNFLMLGISYEIQSKEESLRQDLGYDFYAWCSLLLSPEDRAAYVSVLRGPLANVSDNAVIHIVSIQQQSQKNSDAQSLFCITLSEQLNKAGLSEDAARLAIMKEAYNKARSFVEENDLQGLLNHFWLACGYRYVLLRNVHTHPFLTQYHILKSLIASCSHEGLGACIERLHALLLEKSEDKTEGIRVLSEQGESGVQIMTIHKSKGLEFPVVIVADTGREFRKPNKARFANIDGLAYINFGLPDDPVYALRDGEAHTSEKNGIWYLIRKHEEHDLQEQLRVLYVACTRAQERLYISGVFSENAVCEDDKPIKTQLDMLMRTLPEKHRHGEMSIHEVNALLRQAKEKKRAKHKSDEAYAKKIETILEHSHKTSWKENNIAHAIRMLTPSQVANIAKTNAHTKAEGSKVPLPTLEIDAVLDEYALHREFGILCHEMLKHGCNGHEDSYERLPGALDIAFLRIDKGECEALIDCARRCVQGFFQSALWQQRSTKARIFTEYKIYTHDETHCVSMSAVMDLIILEEKHCKVVDYKVGLHKNEEKYHMQLQAYAYALEAFFATRLEQQVSVTPYLFYLRAAECQEVQRDADKTTLYAALEGTRSM